MAQVDEQIESISSFPRTQLLAGVARRSALSQFNDESSAMQRKKDAIRFSPHAPARLSMMASQADSSRVALPAERGAVISLRVPSDPEACPGCSGGRGRSRKSQE